MKAPHPTKIARLYPPQVVSDLLRAASVGDLSGIDQITDHLAQMGLARARTDATLFGSLQAEQRTLQVQRAAQAPGERAAA